MHAQSISHVQLFATLWTVTHQAPLFMGFSRQEYWRLLLLLLSRFSRVRLFATLWTVTHQAPLSMGFSRQEYWSGLRCPSPGNLPDLRIEPTFLTYPALQVGSLPLVPPRKHLFTPSNMCMFNSKNHYLPACVVVQLPSHV